MEVRLTPEGQQDYANVPTGMKPRIYHAIERLKQWPDVSGVKALRHHLKGTFRIRTGDWRILFRVESEMVVIYRIDNRRDVYER